MPTAPESSAPRLRRAVVADAAALAALAAETFTETFAADNRPEDLAAHLAASYGVAQQTAELQDPGVITLVAEQDGALVGFAQIRHADAPVSVTAAASTTRSATHPAAVPVELQRLYLRRVAHGTGLGAALMHGAREAAVALGGTHLWLGVWERNPRAIAFYMKSGFVRVGSHDFFVGDDRQTDWLLMTPLPSAGHPARASRDGMPDQLYINIPVADFPRSMAFYEALGFTRVPEYSGDDAGCVAITDTVFVMLCPHAKFREFTPKAICDTTQAVEMLLNLRCDSREAVDTLVATALASGGSTHDVAEDFGFMYTHSFLDPDGHGWGLFCPTPSSSE